MGSRGGVIAVGQETILREEREDKGIIVSAAS